MTEVPGQTTAPAPKPGVVVFGVIASIVLLALFLGLQAADSAVLELPSQWLWVSVVPVLVALVTGGFVGKLKAGASGIEFESVEVGGQKLTVQEVSEKLGRDIEDLQKKVSELRQHLQQEAQPAAITGTVTRTTPVRRILWVDDQPTNNAFEIARLHSSGVEVVQATSTAEAMRLLSDDIQGFGAVISDLGRREGGTYDATAGIKLIRDARAAGVNTAIFIYSSARAAQRKRDDVLTAGGNGITASPVELFEMLRPFIPPAA